MPKSFVQGAPLPGLHIGRGHSRMSANLAQLEAFVLERMGTTKLAGMSLAVVKGGEVIYSRGFGARNLAQGLPATPDTLYGIGSVTKSFTCLAILQLQERGLLRVDDPVEQYLPLMIRPFGEPILIRHLMSHTSGIPALAYAEAVLRFKRGASDTYLPMGSTADMLAFVNGAGDWVHARPGERWFYLNEGYVLLGALIEKLSGQSYADYVTEHILQPLGMSRSFFKQEQIEADRDAAVPYAMDPQGKHLPSTYTYGQVTADGGLISSVNDMAKYITMFMRGGEAPQGRILSPESLGAMMTPAIAVPQEDPATGERPMQYCWGLHTLDLFGRRAVGHGGSVGVATAAMRFLPEEDLGVMVLANGSGYGLSRIADFALALMVGEDPWQLPALRTEQILESLTGVYETYRGTMRMTLKRQGDLLSLQYKDKHAESTTPLIPLSLDPDHSRFAMLDGGQRSVVEFIRREGGAEMILERYKYRRTGSL